MSSVFRIERPNYFQRAKEPKEYTGDDLFDRYFWVKVNTLQNMNEHRLREFGVRTSGVPELDTYIPKQEIRTEWSINMMFEKWRRGVKINVINYSDTVIIYNIIQSHLQKWAQYLQRGVNVGDSPFKDLIELDMFSAIIYDKAKCMFTREERTSAIASNFVNMSSLNFGNILRRRTERVTTIGDIDTKEVTTIGEIPPEEGHEIDRQSYKSVFEEQAEHIQAWRKRD